MVSKISIIAIVLVVSVPILMGYAMAFEEVEKVSWDETNTRSITGLLNNDVAWSYNYMNSYTINGQVIKTGEVTVLMEPYYVQIGASPATSLPTYRGTYSANDDMSLNNDLMLAGVQYVFYVTPDMTIHAYVNGGTTVDITGATLLYYYRPMEVGAVREAWVVIDNGGVISYTHYNQFNPARIDADVEYIAYSQNPNYVNDYANPTYGWTINQKENTLAGVDHYWTVNDLHSTLLTMSVDFGPLMKNMVNGTSLQLEYQLQASPGNPDPTVIVIDKTDDSNITMTIDGTPVPVALGSQLTDNNVWQLTMDLEKYTWDYVRSMPGQFGRASAYFSMDSEYVNATPEYITGLSLPDAWVGAGQDFNGPTYRAEVCYGRNSSYPVMTNINYDPASQLLMDSHASYSITLSDLGNVGESIGWGGNTYTINDGKITVNSISMKVSELTLESRYINGERVNIINGRQISTGSNSLQLNGTWSAIISFSEEEYSTYTSTEWTPGKFAWNGVDQSFALMGLITCAAVFVGLGMYGARSGAKVGKLMIICGAAAFVFLAIM